MSPEEALTLRPSDVYADPGQRRRLLAEVRKQGKLEPCEALLRRKDGSTLLGLIHMQEVHLGDENVLMTLIEDITQQKQNERHVNGVRDWRKPGSKRNTPEFKS